MFLHDNCRGIYSSPDSGAGDSPGDGAGDTPGSGSATVIPGTFDPTTLIGPLSVTFLYGNVWKTGNTLPLLRVQLTDAKGTKPDLTNATIVFTMTSAFDTVVLATGPGVADPDQVNNPGILSYAWQTTDLAKDGAMVGDIQVTFPPSGSSVNIATFPDDGDMSITVKKSIS